MSEQGAAELYEHRNDPDEWDDNAVEIDVQPSGSEVVSFRIPSEEFDRVSRAAREAGESLSEFVRSAVRIRLEAPPAVSAQELMSGMLGRVVIYGHETGAARTGLRAGSAYVQGVRIYPQSGTATTCEGVAVPQ